VQKREDNSRVNSQVNRQGEQQRKDQDAEAPAAHKNNEASAKKNQGEAPYICICMYVCMYVYIYIYIYIYRLTHVCVRAR
jgi:hypothetical protein